MYCKPNHATDPTRRHVRPLNTLQFVVLGGFFLERTDALKVEVNIAAFAVKKPICPIDFTTHSDVEGKVFAHNHKGLGPHVRQGHIRALHTNARNILLSSAETVHTGSDLGNALAHKDCALVRDDLPTSPSDHTDGWLDRRKAITLDEAFDFDPDQGPRFTGDEAGDIRSDTETKSSKAKNIIPPRQTANNADGIDLSLPPLNNVEDCVEDMMRKSLQHGLKAVLDHLHDQPIRIGTMFSGTEFPLIAMKLISDGLEKIG